MKYQIRYLGESGPDPETLSGRSLEVAVQAARERLEQTGAVALALMSDGFVVCTLTRTEGEVVALCDQTLANAGIYRFNAPQSVWSAPTVTTP